MSDEQSIKKTTIGSRINWGLEDKDITPGVDRYISEHILEALQKKMEDTLFPSGVFQQEESLILTAQKLNEIRRAAPYKTGRLAPSIQIETKWTYRQNPSETLIPRLSYQRFEQVATYMIADNYIDMELRTLLAEMIMWLRIKIMRARLGLVGFSLN